MPNILMDKNKNAKFLKSLLGIGCLCFGVMSMNAAQAYQVKNIFKTEHFAVNEVILDAGETLDSATQSSITGDIKTQNRLDKIYQSTTVVFPAGSVGYKGKINTPIEGVLTIANYNTGKDRILFNKKVKYLSEGGIYISFDQLIEMVNQKALNPLLRELKKVPVILTNVPVSSTGYDPTTSSFYITAVDDGAIVDTRIDDSVYYSKDNYLQLNDTCRVTMLAFIDRMVANIPLFISARGAVNYISCKNNTTSNKAAAGKAAAQPAPRQ